MTFRGCCCVCSSTHRVFVPCPDTYSVIDYRAPILTNAQFAAMSFSEQQVYKYHNPIDTCDAYCGTWQCVTDAEDTQCHPDGAGGATSCGTCADWTGTVEQPFRLIRASEEAAFPARFTSLDDCCDTSCPVNCGQGEIVPTDCGVCFDWATALNTATLFVGVTNVVPGQILDAAGAELASVKITSVYAENVSTAVNGTTGDLEISFDLVAFFYRSTPERHGTADDCTTEPFFCCMPCLGETIVNGCPQAWRMIRTGQKITVPCMTQGSGSTGTGNTSDTVGLSCTSPDVTSVVGCDHPGVGNGTSVAGSAAGWAATSHPVYSQTNTIGANLAQMMNMPSTPAGGSVVNAQTSYLVECRLTTNPRPSTCP